MCGIVGVHAPGQEAAGLASLALFALQHRGQESAGVAVSDGEGVMVYKDLGMVAQVLDERRLPSLRGHLAIAHCRYSTTGSTLWENSQPSYRLGPRRAVAAGHNGNLVNTGQLLERLRGGKRRMSGTSDTELLTALLSDEPADDLVDALGRGPPGISGAFSLGGVGGRGRGAGLGAGRPRHPRRRRRARGRAGRDGRARRTRRPALGPLRRGARAPVRVRAGLLLPPPLLHARPQPLRGAAADG